MAATIRLYVIEAPLTIDHLILALSGTLDSGFFVDQNVMDYLGANGSFEYGDAKHRELKALDEPMRLRIEAAKESVENNAECATAILKRYPHHAANMPPEAHIHWLAPDIRLGESTHFKNDSTLWTCGDHVIVDTKVIRAIINALNVAIADPDTEDAFDVANPDDVRSFLEAHIGKPMMIGRD
jgi:hypothetical protein